MFYLIGGCIIRTTRIRWLCFLLVTFKIANYKNLPLSLFVMALSNEVVEKLKKAGKIASVVREESKAKCVSGITFLELVEFCEKRIIELEGGIAWVQASPTVTAAHFCPTLSDNPVIKDGDLIKIDIGVHVEGYIADTSTSVAVGNNELHLKLIEAAQNSLNAAINIAKPGTRLRDLGIAQQNEATKMGFSIITNLSGHTLERNQVHGGITIPTFDDGDNTVLTEGMVLAIEPFITTGKGKIHEKGEANVFMVADKRNTRSTYGRKMLPYLKSYNGLPVSRKDLEKKFGKLAAIIGIRDLVKEGILQAYPPLVEITESPVAQMEHSLIITKDEPIVYTR